MLKDKDFDIMFFGVFEEHSGFNRGFSNYSAIV